MPALTGGCLCGAVRFELDRVPESVGYCHCTRCQRRSGTAADGSAKGFCRECGSHLFSRRQDDPTRIGVRLGVLDGDHGLRPQYRQHLASAASWEPVPDDGLARFDGARPN